jgi:hypothetical protein
VNPRNFVGDPAFGSSHLQNDAAGAVALVRQYLPKFEAEFKFNLDQAWWSFALPCPAGAQYRFSLHGEVGGERQISAQEQGHRRFWYSALEMTDFSDDASALNDEFERRLKLVLEHPTRITERRGIMWVSYKAEYEDDGSWHRLRGGVAYLGIGFGVPFFGTRCIYTSPRVIDCV